MSSILCINYRDEAVRSLHCLRSKYCAAHDTSTTRSMTDKLLMCNKNYLCGHYATTFCT